MKWTAHLIVDFAKSRWPRKRINTLPVFGVSRNKTLLVDSGRDRAVVLAQAFESSRFPLEQGESFSDLSCLTCARRAVRLAGSVSNLASLAMSELGMRKVQILSWLLQNVKLRRQVQRDQQRFDRRQELHGRPTRLLLYAKMLLVPISFFLCGVDYSLEGSTFSLSKCDFSRLFHTERSWHTYRFTVVFVSGRQDLPSDARAFSSFEA